MHSFYLSYLKSSVNVCTIETANRSQNTDASNTSPKVSSSFVILHDRDPL